MLTFKLDGYILNVQEVTHTFDKTTVKISQYNIRDWVSRVNNDPFVPMTEGAIEWVKKHYLPKVGIYK